MEAHLPDTWRLALLDEQDGPGGHLHAELRRMGHDPAVFARPAEFFSALGNAQRFDILLLAVKDEMVRNSLCAVCKALNIATLLVIRDGQWEGLMPWNDEDPCWDDVIGLDRSHTEDLGEELEWRMRALRRRRPRTADAPVPALAAAVPMAAPTGGSSDIMVCGDYQFLRLSNTVLHRGQRIHLQPRQFAFASELFRNAGKVVTRDWLWHSIWPTTVRRPGARVLDVCAANIRRKLDLHPENGFVLRAVYRQGYQLICVDPPTPG